MSIIKKVLKRNFNSPFSKYVKKNYEYISILSFIIYYLPIFVLVFSNESFLDGSGKLPRIYSILCIWYFVGLYFLDKINSEYIRLLICLPVYYSMIISYYIFKIFRNKEKYPDVKEEHLPFHIRKIKIKKLKRKSFYK